MRALWNAVVSQQYRFSWSGLGEYLLIFTGASLQALAIRLFLVPAHLVSGGISGAAQIINYYTGWPIGVMIFLGNVPLFLLGWRFLGGPRFLIRTAFAVIVVSFLTDFLARFLPANGITADIVLNSLYGAVVSGIGYGLVYRGRGTSGGTDILVRIINHWRSVSLSQAYLMTDAVVVLLAGVTFGWTNALYALLVLYGSNVVRTAVIITEQPEAVSKRILDEMERGVTILSGKGAFTGELREVLYVVVSRSEVSQVKTLVREEDPQAFMVIGQAFEALGEGFKPWHP
ncbi:MAG: hypothetical protein H6Q37_2272 [Chloroflexi bacterium]|nr:hypothetical protein [Chloroflexota bacterium]